MSYTAEPSLTTPGILDYLHEHQESSYNPLFVASTSSADIYNLLDPDTKDAFYTTNRKDYFEFKFHEPINITGVKIYSYSQNFPRSFDIRIDGEIVVSIEDAKELDGKDKEMEIKFDEKNCKEIRFIITGPSWDKGTYFVLVRRIELISPDPQYKDGVFKTLVNQRSDDDPHKCGVLALASNLDFNSFYSVDAKYCISTISEEDSWFQVELIKGVATLTGFRLKRCNQGKMKSYKIIATDDVNKTKDEWTTLFEVDEKSPDEHQVLDIYQFSQPSPPVRFIRIIQTGPNWGKQQSLKFLHFDLFGTYN